jgi:hypothetical protein
MKKKKLKKVISTVRVPQTRAVLHIIFGAISIYEAIRVSEGLSITPVAKTVPNHCWIKRNMKMENIKKNAQQPIITGGF